MEVPLQSLCLQGLSKLQEAMRTQSFMSQRVGDNRCSLCLPAQPPASCLLLPASPFPTRTTLSLISIPIPCC